VINVARLRTVIHLDMDAFFASIEQRDHPQLLGKPVIIGGSAESRGVVSTCSYEARKFGVHSAMPMIQAKRLCPNGVFLPVNRRKYSEVSRQMFTILRKYTPVIEPLSIDEAFLDVTGCERLFGDGLAIARKLKLDIQNELQLTASVGISYNKFLAKLASDLDKPNGLVSITPHDLTRIVHPLPVSRLWGIGKKSAEQLMRLGLRTIGDVAQMDVNRVRTYIGNLADHIYRLAHGIDERPVEVRQEAKSIGQETTFSTDVTDHKLLETTLLAQIESVTRRLRARNLECRTVTIKIRYAPFRTITKSHTLPTPTSLDMVLFNVAKHLLQKCSMQADDAIRLIGISVSHFTADDYTEQLSLFDEEVNTAKQSQLAKTIDALKDKFGDQVIQRARLIDHKSDQESGS
jgi:DNA polymerase-4